MLDRLAGATYFSTLDLKAGFWQIELDEDSKQKTAFAIPMPHRLGSQFEFNVLPFGLTNAPATFSRMMEVILGDLIPTKCQVYIDDVVVYSSDFDEHLANLQQVFDRIRQAGLKLNARKCQLGCQQIKYLGHVVTGRHVRPDPAKVEAVQLLAAPRTLKQLQSFLGLVGYYRRFIPAFAEKAAPLYKLLPKGAPYKWNDEQQKAFETLKEALQGDVMLHYPDMNKHFILKTDASTTGLGAILLQKDGEGRERVVA